MSKVIEVYRILEDKLGEEEARIVAEAFEELGGVLENITTKEDVGNIEKRVEDIKTDINILTYYHET